ncbi:MAG TPA: hypothetical protein DCP08_00685 [Chloroflexi bacterium]|nr:hypothetical protein [Chloroflexota bacterium]
MEQTTFKVPKMYADHHVKAVRDALLGLDGVEEVMASSAFKIVQVSYDPDLTSPETIEEKLQAAGYGPGEDWEVASVPEGKEDRSPWFQLIGRVTETNKVDLEMSGEFRLY